MFCQRDSSPLYKVQQSAIVDEVSRVYGLGQPVLVGTHSISDSETIAAHLDKLNLVYHILNGLQTVEEAKIVAAAGQCYAITISTNLAGRGTDISVPARALAVGGLHVIIAECQLSSRMDRQLIEPCGRQGNPGTAQMFVSAEDTLIARFGTRLANAIRRESGINGEAKTNFSATLRHLQLTAEKQQFRARVELLWKDIGRDSLFGAAPTS